MRTELNALSPWGCTGRNFFKPFERGVAQLASDLDTPGKERQAIEGISAEK